MTNTALLISEYMAQLHPLRPVIHALRFEVVEAEADMLGPRMQVSVPYTLAVLHMPLLKMERALPVLKGGNMASKVLALVPFDAHGMETHLARLGADDVLALPVTRSRLEVTLHNLLRLHALECRLRA